MTMGAPKMAVTVLMLSSVGARAVRASMSHSKQNPAPHKKLAGMSAMGLELPVNTRTMWGAAMPTKDTGPAKAATQAESSPDSTTNSACNARTFTPMLRAYSSPRR